MVDKDVLPEKDKIDPWNKPLNVVEAHVRELRDSISGLGEEIERMLFRVQETRAEIDKKRRVLIEWEDLLKLIK